MTAAPPRSPARPGGCWRRSASPTRLDGVDLPDPRDPGQRGAEAGRHRCSSRGTDDDPLGIMVENRLLRAALRDAALEAERVALLMPARPARSRCATAPACAWRSTTAALLAAPLLVGAEGRNSPTREAAGHRGRALALRSCRDRRHHRARAAARRTPPTRSSTRPARSRSCRCSPATTAGRAPRSSGRCRPRDAGADARPARPRAGRTRSRSGWAAFSARSTLGRPALELSARLPPCRDDHRRAARAWSATPRTASIRSPARASISASATPPLWPRCWSRAPGSASTSAMPQLLARYERWRSLDTFMVALATDSLTRLYGVPGRAASAVRRFGMGVVQRVGPLKDRFMAEARGESANCRCCCGACRSELRFRGGLLLAFAPPSGGLFSRRCPTQKPAISQPDSSLDLVAADSRWCRNNRSR